jgi:hypothetical protein
LGESGHDAVLEGVGAGEGEVFCPAKRVGVSGDNAAGDANTNENGS